MPTVDDDIAVSIGTRAGDVSGSAVGIADATPYLSWTLPPGMEQVRSLNPVVGETNDGYLNDIRARPLRPEHVRQALETASVDNVEEGAIGAGTGTVAFGWKGGIGTSSRRLDPARGSYTVGVLVQSNYGGRLTIGGVALDGLRPQPVAAREAPPASGDGSASPAATLASTSAAAASARSAATCRNAW